MLSELEVARLGTDMQVYVLERVARLLPGATDQEQLTALVAVFREFTIRLGGWLRMMHALKEDEDG